MPVRHHTVQVPATSANLGPGYDAFGLALGRYLVARSLPRALQEPRVHTVGEGSDDVATGDDNLVWRAFVRFCEEQERPVPDVALEVVNRIPLERGMGSSSSAIVAGLVLARALTGTRMGDRELVTLAAELEGHPDNVAPAVLGGLVACTVDDAGELVLRRRNPVPSLRPILLVPSFRQATSAARSALPAQLSRADVTLQASRAGHVLGALGGLWPVAPGAVGDRLHEPARLRDMGASGKLLDELRAAGLHAWLSGAGPSVAVAGGRDPAALRTCEVVGADHDFEVELLATDLSGALCCPDDGCALVAAPGCMQCPRERLS